MRCIKCDSVKDDIKFQKRIKNGRTYFSKKCYACVGELNRKRPSTKKYRKDHHLRRKLKALDHYGGRCCCWCGDTDLNALVMDHINNHGNKHRREISGHSSVPIQYWLKANNYPSGFQVLCASCNQAKALNGGILPENRRKLTSDEWFERIGVGGI